MVGCSTVLGKRSMQPLVQLENICTLRQDQHGQSIVFLDTISCVALRGEITVAAERLSAEMDDRHDEIETALCLGATCRQAAEPAIKTAYRSAMIPTMNTMAATGIVTLPGVMTGQILSGTPPIIAVRYQIAIMCAITGAVAITSFLILLQGYRQYFTAAHQLKKKCCR